MISGDGQTAQAHRSRWISFFPGMGVLATVAASLIADKARDVFDPRGGIGHP